MDKQPSNRYSRKKPSGRERDKMSMDMQGEERIGAPVETVWAALNDPEVLKACIPGCEALEKVSDNELAATVPVGSRSGNRSAAERRVNVRSASHGGSWRRGSAWPSAANRTRSLR